MHRLPSRRGDPTTGLPLFFPTRGPIPDLGDQPMPNSTHLEHLSIRGFRGLEHVEFEDLCQFNLIVGKNDVGKTSVLEAAMLISGAVPEVLFRIQNLRKCVVEDTSEISLLLHRMDLDQRVDMSASTRRDQRRLTVAAPNAALTIDPKTQLQNGGGQKTDMRTDIVSYSSVPQLTAFDYQVVVEPHDVSESRIFRFSLSVSNAEIKISPTTVVGDREESLLKAWLLAPGSGYDSASISNVLIAKRQDDLLKCLRSVHPYVQSIATKNDTTYVDIGLDVMIPLDMCGSGFARAAQIFAQCLAGDVQILLVDEIGCGLHHSAIGPLIEALLTVSEEQNVQVFVTTHSLEVLRSLEKTLGNDKFGRFRDKMATYVLARRQDGGSCAYRYDYDQFAHAVSHGIEIR